jgi:transcriptional regulator GlxA family with amidase domain
LAGLRNPHVARALALLHGDIARRWTVDDLGREVGLSRSALADRFIQLIGVPPMHYLASWRMQVASQTLRDTNASLAQVAELVGYDAEAAFSRAFKKEFDTAPATWRRANRVQFGVSCSSASHDACAGSTEDETAQRAQGGP